MLAAVITFYVALVSTPASAAPTQEDVFRSISQNVNESSGGGKLLAVVAAGVAVVLLLAVLLQQRQQRATSPKSVQHPGRLLKEVMKVVPLKPVELKQLKLLVERKRDDDEDNPGEVRVESPLTLILCPSVLVRAMRNPPAKVDRKVIAQIARKLGAQGHPPGRGR